MFSHNFLATIHLILSLLAFCVCLLFYSRFMFAPFWFYLVFCAPFCVPSQHEFFMQSHILFQLRVKKLFPYCFLTALRCFVQYSERILMFAHCGFRRLPFRTSSKHCVFVWRSFYLCKSFPEEKVVEGRIYYYLLAPKRTTSIRRFRFPARRRDHFFFCLFCRT